MSETFTFMFSKFSGLHLVFIRIDNHVIATRINNLIVY